LWARGEEIKHQESTEGLEAIRQKKKLVQHLRG
jgi:hypothetical protein